MKKAEEGLRELQRANDTLTDLVVHDIKNISSTMFAWLELIRDGDLGPLTDDQAGALARIVERNEELVHLSEELLDIARAAEGKIVIEKKSYVLEDQLREVIKAVQPNTIIKIRKANSHIQFIRLSPTLDENYVKRLRKKIISTHRGLPINDSPEEQLFDE